MAEHDLQHVPQAVLDVVRIAGAVSHEPHAEDIETVQLVHHRDEEGAVVRPEVRKPVRRGEDRRPVVVSEQGELGVAGVQRVVDGGQSDRET